MANQSFKRVVPGGQLSAAELNRQADTVEQLDRVALGGQGLAIRRHGGGIQIDTTFPPPVWVNITSGTQPYAYTAQKQDTRGTWSNWTDGPSGTVSSVPAYEVNGATNVPSGSIVQAWLSPDQTYYLFAYPSSMTNLVVTTLTTSELILVVNSTIAISSTTNNLSITLTNGSKIPLNVTAATTLTGIVAPSPAAAVVLWLQNIGTQPLTLSNQSASSTAANRFQTPNGEDFTLGPAGSTSCCECMIEYVPSLSRWWFPGPVPGGPVNSVVTNTPTEGGLYGGGTWFIVDPTNFRVAINTATTTASLVVTPFVITDLGLVISVTASQTADILRTVHGTGTTIKHTPTGTAGSRTAINHSTVDTAALSVYSTSDTDDVFRGTANSNTSTSKLLNLSVPSTAVSYTMDSTGVVAISSAVGGAAAVQCFGSTTGSGEFDVGLDANNLLQMGCVNNGSGNIGQAFMVVINAGTDCNAQFNFGASSVTFNLKTNDFGHWDWIFFGVSSAIEGTATAYTVDYTTGTTTKTPQVGFAGGWRDAANATHKGRGFLVACDSTAGSNPTDGASTDRECVRWESDGTNGNVSVGGTACTDGTPLTIATGATADVKIHGASYIWPSTTGSSGQQLQTNGSSPATLSWAASGRSGTVPLYYKNVNNTISNTTSETAFANISYTLPANSLDNTVCWLKISMKGQWGGNVVNDDVQIRVKLSNTTVFDTGTQMFGLSAAVSGAQKHWFLEGRVVPLNTNAVDGRASLMFSSLINSATNTTQLGMVGTEANVAGVTLAINSALSLSVTAQWSAASTADTITLGDLFVELFHT